MNRKNIRRIVIRQLKNNHPHWKRMNKKSKKRLLKQVMNEVADNYDYSQILDLPIEQLIGVEDQVPTKGIRSLSEMSEYIDNFYRDNLFDFDKRTQPYSEIVDKELQFVDDLFDNPIINSLLAPDG